MKAKLKIDFDGDMDDLINYNASYAAIHRRGRGDRGGGRGGGHFRGVVGGSVGGRSGRVGGRSGRVGGRSGRVGDGGGRIGKRGERVGSRGTAQAAEGHGRREENTAVTHMEVDQVPKVERRTCNICKVKGHLQKNCPTVANLSPAEKMKLFVEKSAARLNERLQSANNAIQNAEAEIEAERKRSAEQGDSSTQDPPPM